jgi:hypothetical protein
MTPTIPIPAATVEARTQYVDDCIDALRAGRISEHEASIIYARVMGWSDSGTIPERVAYRALAGQWVTARRAAA